MECIGTEHYIIMWMWNVQGWNITKQYGMYRDRTLLLFLVL